jgi:SNF2 family DNA or RNA helicase
VNKNPKPMSVSLLEYYINQHAAKEVRDRGLALFFDKKVGELNINHNTNIVEADVEGKGDTYTVIVSDYKTMNINAECNCPYNYGGICKHSVAVIYKMISTIYPKKQLPDKSKKPVIISRKSTTPHEIADFDTLTSTSLKKYFRDGNRWYAYEDITIRKATIIDSGLIFIVDDDRNYSDYEMVVTVYKQNDTYFSTCSCDRAVIGLCIHQYGVLRQLIQKGNNTLQYFQPDFITKTLQIAANQNNIPEKFATTDNFLIEIDEYLDLKIKPKGKLDGLLAMPEDKKEYLSDYTYRAKFDKSIVQQSFVEIEKSSSSIAYVFQFDDYTDGMSEELVAIKGILSKNKKKFRTAIQAITFADLPDLNATEKDTELLILAEQLLSTEGTMRWSDDHDDYNMHVLRKAHQTLMKIFRTLEDHDLVFYLDPEEIYLKKNTIAPIKLSNRMLTFEIILKSDDDFIWLEPLICESENKFQIDEMRRMSDFIWLHDETFYLLGAYSMYQAINFFYHHKQVKMFKANAADFFRDIVIPLSERFNIDIEGMDDFDISETYLKPLKKQVYLSEIEGHILFTPVVVYNHKKEIEVMMQGNVIEENDGRIRIFRRNAEYEAGFIHFIRSLHQHFSNQFNESSLALPLEEMLGNNWFFDAFQEMKAKDTEVLGLQKLKSFKYSPYRPKITTGIKSGVDWFDVSLQISFGEEVISLKKLKKFITNKEKFIRLGDGSIGMLPEEWIEKLEKYFRVGEVKDEKIQVSKLRFGIVDELFDQIDDEAVLTELAEKKKRLESFSEISKTGKPAAIKATLRDYQKEGVNWLKFLNEMRWGGILADDMGLGKTVQILTLIANIKTQKPKTSLVVVPTTLIFNWENEIKKFYPSLKVFFYYGINREKDHEQFQNYNLVVTTYGLMVNDIEILSKIPFNYIILDESQAIKNPLSKRFKAASLLKGNNKLTLTGTPIENNTFDLFAQMTFVNPGFLGTQKYFKDYYSTPIDRDQDPARAGELRKMINPFILRRTKEQVATELPPKTEDVIFCRMEKKQWNVYEQYRNKYRDYLMRKIDEKGMNNAKMYVLEGLTKLRQICNSPKLIEDEKHINHSSVKLDELMRQINEKTGKHKIVVFSQFVKMLKLIEEELKRDDHNYEYFDGSSTQKQRRESVNRFQNDEDCRVFLISLKAGGTGINLTAADYVYIFDPWWNPAVENQAIDRTYRIGQNKKVFAYRLICKETVEEKILRYQERKRKVATDIIRTEDSFVKQLTKDDINDLFG